MLTFVMRTRNEGPAFETTLQALGHAMQRGDRVLVFDAGSTDGTLALVRDFGDVVGCEVIALDRISLLPTGELLALGLDLAQTPYVTTLGAQDWVDPARLWQLRKALKAQSPQLAVINSAWRGEDTAHPVARIDKAVLTALPTTVSASDLYAMCPDPRRFVLACAPWRAYRSLFTRPQSDAALYAAVLSATSHEVALWPEEIIQHAYRTFEATDILDTLQGYVMARPPADHETALRGTMIWADDAVSRMAPDGSDGFVHALDCFVKALPRHLQHVPRLHPGVTGALCVALQQKGPLAAELMLLKNTLNAQQDRAAIHARQIANLTHELQVARPDAAYLWTLYGRARAEMAQASQSTGFDRAKGS